MNKSDKLREVRFHPYRKGAGPVFTLRTYWLGNRIGYELRQDGRALFEGEDFRPSPMHSIDGDQSIAALMGFLTLRPGDTDEDYFDGYSAEQLEFCDQHAESLAAEVERRFPEN